MITPNIRLYLPDIINGDTQQILDKLVEVTDGVGSAKLYFWYHEPDLKANEVKKFVDMWESQNHKNWKTIIRPYYFDTQNDFIWYDVISHKMLNSLTPNASGIKNMYTRFSWRYGEPNGIVKGLEEFKVIYKFVSNDKPIKKQKRNDGEDSNHRQSELHK